MMKKIGFYVILLLIILFNSLSFADEQTYNRLAFYFDTGLFLYQDSPYLRRMESLGIFDRYDVWPSFDTGIFFKIRDDLSIGGSIMYALNEGDIHDGDYEGYLTLENTIFSVPVRYHIRKGIFLFSFGASLETPFIWKSYYLSTEINQDNNGDPEISGDKFGYSVGLGLLASIDAHVTRKISLNLQYWFHFALPIHDMNEYGDSLNPGGSNLVFGMKWWI